VSIQIANPVLLKLLAVELARIRFRQGLFYCLFRLPGDRASGWCAHRNSTFPLYCFKHKTQKLFIFEYKK